MSNDFQNLFAFSITPGEVVVNILSALICDLLLSFLYRWTYEGPTFSIAYINLKDKSESAEFVRELKWLNSINYVNL